MKKLNIALALVMCAWTAHATDVATSQAYVDTATGNLQTNLPAKTTDKVVTYTTTAGTTGEREIKTTLGNESTNQSDTGIPTVGTVKTAVDDKQVKLKPLSNVNIATYTGTETPIASRDSGIGTVTTTPIYDSTINTFDNGLVTAKTLNDAVIAGVNAEVTRINTPQGALWQFNRTAPKVLPTTANLPANIDTISDCYKPVIPTEDYPGRDGGCSTTTINTLNRGDWAVVYSSLITGITYDTTCVGTYCGKEARGISACADPFTGNKDLSPVSREHWDELDAAYESGKNGTTPTGKVCYCKLTNPSVPGAGWAKYGSRVRAELCANECAQHCAGHVGRAAFRGVVFGATPVPAQSE